MTSLEQHASEYWLLCRQFRVNRWGQNDTYQLGDLLFTEHEQINVRACDLWFRVSEASKPQP